MTAEEKKPVQSAGKQEPGAEPAKNEAAGEGGGGAPDQLITFGSHLRFIIQPDPKP